MKKQFSFSELSLYQKDPELYYQQYVLGDSPEPTSQMLLGSLIHTEISRETPPTTGESDNFVRFCDTFGSDPVKMARAVKNVRKDMLPLSEHPIQAKTGWGTRLLSIFDNYDKENRLLREYKTTENGKSWDQLRVDNDEQLSFYAYVYWLSRRSYFREIILVRIDTKTGNVKRFKTTRGPKDIQYIADKIEITCDVINDRGWWKKRLSRTDREKQMNPNLFETDGSNGS